MPSKIIIVRHAPTKYNKKEMFMGSMDIPADGIDTIQVEQVRSVILQEGCATIYSSPLRRAVETAQAIGGCQLQVLTDSRLMERSLGEWEGIAKAVIHRQYSEAFLDGKMDFYYTPPQGEAYGSLIQRVSSFLLDVYRPNRNIAVVTHNGVFRVMKSLLTGDGLSNVFSPFEPYLTPECFILNETILDTLRCNPFYTVDKQQ